MAEILSACQLDSETTSAQASQVTRVDKRNARNYGMRTPESINCQD